MSEEVQAPTNQTRLVRARQVFTPGCWVREIPGPRVGGLGGGEGTLRCGCTTHANWVPSRSHGLVESELVLHQSLSGLQLRAPCGLWSQGGACFLMPGGGEWKPH